MNRQLFEDLERSLAGIATIVHRGFINKIFIGRKGSCKIPIVVDGNATKWQGVDIRSNYLSEFTPRDLSKILQAIGDFLDGNEREQARKRYFLMYPGTEYRYVTDIDFVGATIDHKNNEGETQIRFKYGNEPRLFSTGDLEYAKSRCSIVASLIYKWKVEAKVEA